MLTVVVVAALLLVAALACEAVRACCARMLAEPIPRTVDVAASLEPAVHADTRL